MKPTPTPSRLIALVWLGSLTAAFAQGTAFTYQGRLTENGQPAAGRYDFRCQLYDKAGPPGDALVSTTVTNAAVLVSNGLFVLNLDFGAAVFNGAERWLLVTVRTNGAPGFTTLEPRQRISPTPYAITSGHLSGTLPAGQVTGALSPAALPSGGNWPLTSTLTLDTSTLAIDPGNHRVGVGTASPGWPLHVVAGQGVARLDSTASTFGSVLELRNNTASPAYLGAINFNNAAGAFPGQIGYTGSDALTFRTGGAERMRLDGTGRLDVTGASSSVAMNVVDSLGIFTFYRGIKATSDSVFGTAVIGLSDLGTAVAGTSANGFAGSFAGAVQISYASPFEKAQLTVKDPSDAGFARLRMQTGSRALWDIALGTTPGMTNTLRFFNNDFGDVMWVTPEGQLHTRVLTIMGGADIAEPFQMTEKDLPKGSVVVIDEAHPGHLKLSSGAYDKRVAGIVSGAGGVHPGLSLRQHGVMEGDQPVALTGRVYVRADASSGAIEPGDLLTTSELPGHAMKASDHARAQGAVLGKAMSGLREGTGLVLVLVTLQ